MSESCNFQNLNQNCLFSCIQTGCTLDLLTNTVCDPVCNTNICGYDFGSCGYCAPLCFASDLPFCPAACNTASCLNSVFCPVLSYCSPGCSFDMVGNGICDQECLTRSCEFDNSDCIESQIASGCYLGQIGDGICDESCDVDLGYWDGWDCACSAGCTSALLSNNVCDQECNTPSCNFDSQLCSTCSPGCSLSDLGNNICNQACLTPSCYFDLGDCNCAPQCSIFLLSNTFCDSICNTQACGYDAGKCAGCSPTCPPNLRNNGICDSGCSSLACMFDDFDCLCSVDCTPSMLGDSVCDSVCNSYECGYDGGDCIDCVNGCYAYLIGDGKCDLVCNNTQCGYDGGDCFCSPGCTSTLLSNSVCDQECNTEACNLDNGHCTPCTCDLRLISNGICDIQCDNPQCFYDGGDCSCPASCTQAMLSNAQCDSECNSPFCNFDNFYCSQCASGCNWTSINDGVCQVECSVSECGFDGADCSCSHNCAQTSFLEVGCAAGCNNYACQFDNFMCSQCSAGCYSYMINNGRCDSECYNANCGFDGFDCLCSEYCSSIVTCDYNCIIPSCDYSRTVCETAEIARSLINAKLSSNPSSTWNITACQQIDPACITLMLNDNCDSQCNVQQCLFDLGGCSICPDPTCNKCIGSYCFSCKSGYLSFMGTCITYIPQTYTLYSDFPGFLIPSKDTSSLENPTKVYVAPNKVAHTEAGTLQNPYSSLSLALSTIRSQYTKILLMDGNHYLTEIDLNNPEVGYQVSPYTLLNSSTVYKMVTLCTLMCSDENVYGCANESAVILYMDTNVIFFVRFSAGFIIENVIFNGGFSLNPTCMMDSCYYCPYYSEMNSVYYNDKNEPIDIRIVSNNCEGNVGKTFLAFEDGGSLYLSNVTFYNFRQQFYALLDISRVSAVFVNVSFMYVQSSNASGSAVIKQVQGSLYWVLGLVKFVNYGYEYVPNLTLNPFIHLELSTLVQLKYLSLQWNLIYGPNSIFNFINIQEFLLEYSQVTYNRGFNILSLTSDLNEHLQHIVITNVQFSNNLAEGGSILNLNFTQQPKTIFIDSCVFNKNVLDTGLGLLSLKSSSDLYFYTAFILLSNMQFSNNTGGEISCLYFSFLHSLNLSSVQISPGDYSLSSPSEYWVNSSIALGYYYKVYKNSTFAHTISSVYIANTLNTVEIKTMLVQGQVSDNTLDLENNNKIFLTQIQFLQNTPKKAVTLLTNNSYTVFFNTQFLNNTSYFACLCVINQFHTQLYQIQFLNNIVERGTIFIEDADFAISKSVISNNEAIKGSAIFVSVTGGMQLSLTSTLFELNTATEGTIYISYTENYENLLSLLINMCSFTNNSANAGNGIYFESFTVTNSSTITNSRFLYNSGSILGVLVLNENPMQIANCQFQYNIAIEGTVLYVETLSDLESQITISNTLISNNTGESIFLTSSIEIPPKILMDGVAFVNNTGRCLKILKTYIEMNNSYFIANFYTDSPCLHSTESTVIFQNCTIMYNYGLTIGSMRISTSSLFSCTNCTFYFNIANHGGCIYISEAGYIQITSSAFTNNISPSYGPVLYMVDSSTNKSVFHTSIFKSNIVGISGMISALGGAIDIYNSIITENVGYGLSPGISTSMGNMTMYGCVCSKQSGYVGAFISSTSLSNVFVDFSEFYEGSVLQGGAIVVGTSTLNVTNSVFMNLTAQLGGSIAMTTGSSASFYNITVYNSTATDTGGVIYTLQSNTSIYKSSFTLFSDRGIYADKVQVFIIDSSSFTQGSSSEDGGFFLCISCDEVVVSNCHVSEMTSSQGGAISIYYQVNQPKPYCLITNTVFESISATEAGVISCVDYNISIQNSQFYNNSALGSESVWGSGGVIQFSCSINDDCFLDIENSVFMYNYARENGGCVSWQEKMPELNNNSFVDNSAEYGNNLASFAVQIVNFVSDVTANLTLSNVPPGQKVEKNVTFALVDHYGQIVTTDNTTTASLGMNNSDSFVTGTTTETAVKGLITFDNFLIWADADSEQTLLVSSLEIGNKTSVEVQMRNCSLGESFSNKACTVCGNGMFSLDPSQPCLECLADAMCFGSYKIVPKADYWRANNFSTTFYKCPLTGTCLGGEKSQNPSGDCAVGYKGNMCQSCDTGYSRSTGNSCQKCPDKSTNLIYLSLIAILIVLIVCGLVYFNISMADKPVSNYTILIKILLNYIQIIGIVTSMNLGWPDFALNYMKIQQTAGSLSQQSYSFDCLLSQKYNRTNTELYFDKIILYLLMPIVLTGICLFLWSIVSLIKLDQKYIRNHFVGSVVIIALLLHSFIIKATFSPFSCQDIEGNLYLSDDLDIPCWVGTHKFYTLSVALPGGIVWGVVIPVMLLWFMARNKKNFEELAIKQRYGFVIAGYKYERYYWEIIILYRKIMVITASILFGSFSVDLQTLSVLIILLLASYIQADLKPFLTTDMNKMEFRSIIVSIITIYCGLYFLSPTISSTAAIFLFVVLVLFNTLFFGYWTYFFVKDFYKSLVECFKELFNRKRTVVIPEQSNHTPQFKESIPIESQRIIDTSENKEEEGTRKMSSEEEEEEVEEEEKEYGQDDVVPIMEGKRVSAMTVVVNGFEKSGDIAKGSRNTMRYNAFEDDSD